MLEKLIAQIMAGYEISKAEAKMLIDYDLGTLKQGAELIRRSYCGSTFDLCSIINGKSGRCSENCKYCAQSVYYQTGIRHITNSITAINIRRQFLEEINNKL